MHRRDALRDELRAERAAFAAGIDVPDLLTAPAVVSVLTVQLVPTSIRHVVPFRRVAQGDADRLVAAGLLAVERANVLLATLGQLAQG